jgi:hypothetical protein
MLAKSISLRHLNYQLSHISSSIESKEESNSSIYPSDRPLVVLLTWLAAQDKHIEKYSSLYLQKGFDVLTVKTSPFDLLFPTIGARKIAQNCVLTLQKELPQYPSVILHAFSVGAYQFGEILIEMQEQHKLNTDHNRDNHNQSNNIDLEKRIKGIVFDSVVPIEELPNGVSRSITANPFLYKCIKSGINGHLKVFNSIATKYYRAASHAVWNNYMRVPALILVSQNDRIGTAEANQKLTRVWRDLGIDVTWKCWDKSAHVQHLPKHPKEYEELIDRFLNKLNINTNSIAF